MLAENTKHLRDNDNKLIATIWYQDIKGKGTDPMDLTGMEVLTMYSNGKLTNAESIRRMRAKLQEEFKELRGLTYYKRHEAAKGVQKELGYNG